MPYTILVKIAPALILQSYTKTGTIPPVAPFKLISGSTEITNISATNNNIQDTVPASTPLTASVLIAQQSSPAKTVNIFLLVRDATTNTILFSQGSTAFTTVGTGYTYQWVGLNNRTYEVTATASNT